MKKEIVLRPLFACLFLLVASTSPVAQDLKISIQFPAELSQESITGRLYVFTSQRGEPQLSPSWFSPEPFFGQDVVDMEPGKPVVLDDNADGFPVPLSKLPNGKYQLKAVLDHDFYAPSPGDGVGNFYSEAKEVEIDETTGTISLELTQKIEARPFPETEFVKLVTLESKLLSKFHKRPVLEKAAVVLPASYHQSPDRRYPVFYEVSGFGGTLPAMARRYGRRQASTADDQFEYIHVLLTGECKWGHHVYANSATNGPRGDALVEEMIPLIDSKFRTVADEKARFVGGHSSGGWSSIWLQITYPETFGGLWSTSPDPVDFRDYQQTNLYADPPESVYYFADGSKKPLARRGEQVMVWYPDFAKMDDVLGRGGQLRSFEAVFSPLDEKGLPARMWHRTTGKVDPKVVDAWKKYDIHLILKNNWTELAPKLQGKLRILMGTEDTFYLEGATELLGESLKALGSDAKVTLIPGSHSSVLTPQYFTERTAEMKAAFLEHFNLDGTPKK